MNDLRAKSIRGFMLVLAVFAGAIFIAAGTFDYPTGWIYIAVFTACGLAITFYLLNHDPKLLERRINAGPTAEKSMSQKLIMALGDIGVMTLLVIPGLDRRWNWSHVPTAMAGLGDVLIVLGAYLIYRVFRENSFASATIEVAEDQTVITTGPYAVVRHPMYTGVLFWLIGTPLALGSYWGLPAIIVMMPLLAWRIVGEERFLTRHLLGYAAYQNMVRYRLMPFVW